MTSPPPLAAGVVLALLIATLAGCSDSSTSPAPGEDRYDLVVAASQAGGSPELVVVGPGTAAARLFPPGMHASDASPSPDGSRIVFVVADYSQNIGDIWVADRDGSNARQLTFAPELDDQPAWSPANYTIAFRSFRAGREGDIWRMEPDGSNQINMTPDPLPGVTDERHPAWSPGGDYLAYASNAGGDYAIWIMDAAQLENWQLTNTPDLDTEPTWGPSTKEVAFRRCTPALGCDIWIIPFGANRTARRIARAGEQRMPSWSRDGKTIAFIEGPPGGVSQLWTMTPDGSNPVQHLTSGGWTQPINPVWVRRPSIPTPDR